MENTFKDVDCDDIPFLLHDLEAGIHSAPYWWFTWEKFDSLLALVESIWVSMKRWVGMRASEMDVAELTAMAEIDRLIAHCGKLLYDEGDPMLVLGPLVKIAENMKAIWNWMDGKGYTIECYNRGTEEQV